MGYCTVRATVFSEESEQGIHLFIVRTTLDDPAAALIAHHPCTSEDVEMIGQGGAGQSRGFCKLPHRHPFVTRLNEQTKQVQSVLLGQSIEAGKRVV